MRTVQFTWNTMDGFCLSAQAWEPDDLSLHGVICLVHGLGEHIGRYTHVAEFFTSHQFAMVGYDQRGHGKSDGKRGHNVSFEHMMADIHLMLEKTTRQYPNLPVFLYGHSMGGMEVCNFILLNPNEGVTGAIVTDPGLRTNFPVPPLKRMLGKILYNLVPAYTMPNGLERAALSRDKDVVQQYESDPLVHGQVSARLGIDILTRGEWAVNHAADLAIPMLLMQGSADRIVSAAAAREFAQRAGSFCTYKEWDGLYHELHNEPEKAAVLQTMMDWLTEHLPSN